MDIISLAIFVPFLLVLTFLMLCYSHLLKKMRSAVDQIPVALLTMDDHGRLSAINRRARELSSHLAEGGESILREEFRNVLTIGDFRSGGRMKLNVDGALMHFRIDGRRLRDRSGKETGWVIQLAPEEEHRPTEEEERRIGRLEAASTLAAGIAHEVKNPLSALAVNLQLLEENVVATPNPRKVDHYINVIKSEIKRVNAIVDNFIGFARPNVFEMSLCEVEEILHSIITLVAPECEKQHVLIERTVAVGEAEKAMVDEAQIKQAILNIVLNAIQSMPAGGTLTYGVEYGEDVVTLKISDTGGGIPDESLDKIFDLFFTTKKGGSGLGLSTAQKIISGHKGSIEVKNVERGAMFIVTLPLQREKQTWPAPQESTKS